MSKFKITEAKCFEEIAKVIGAKNAEKELFIASQHENCKFDLSEDIWGAFVWYNTKQGNDFWYSISQGVNPYEQ